MAKFSIQDRIYDFDGEYTTEEAMLFYDKANIGMAELDAALGRWNPYAIVTLMYILKKRAGEAVRWQDLMHLPVSAFKPVAEEPTPGSEGSADGSEEAPEVPDPTGDAGTTPGSGTTNT